jgi:hypothetical protein
MDYVMSRSDRLERWAEVLETSGSSKLTPFYEVEFITCVASAPLRQPNSPLDIAYRDPVLRRAGLDSDAYGESSKFFGLSRSEAHRILCSCGYFGTMRATEVARRIRAAAVRDQRRQWLANPLAGFARWLSGWRPLDGITRPA